jgi:GDP-4-dehydro-6-deoxy-D-mannose reductase
VDLSWKAPRFTYEVNVFGTLNVLEAAMTLATPPRVLNVSTAQVYAPSPSVLSEDSPLSPDNPYAASKAMAEFLQVQFRKQSAGGIMTARSFNHAGPGQSPDFVLSSIAKQIAEIEAGRREPKLVLGNLHVKRDFTDVRDVVRAYWLLLEKGNVNEVYNVCSGRSWSIEQLVADFQSVAEMKVAIESHADKRRAREISEVCGDAAKIRAATGWEPQIPLETTIRDLLSYWRSSLRSGEKSEDLAHATPANSK